MFEDNHDCSSTTALAASYFCLARFRIIQDIFTLATKLSLFYRRSNYTEPPRESWRLNFLRKR